LTSDADLVRVEIRNNLCLILGLFPFFCCLQQLPGSTQRYQSFAVYYSDEASSSDFSGFDLLVLDSEYHPDLNTLADRGKTLLGYISLGEVEKIRPYFDEVRNEGILLQENPYWKGSYFVDVRDPRWTSRVIERLIPRILAKGFQGLFLDTLDNPAHLEETDPVRFKGMVSSAARLVKTIRYHYPTIKIMLNRAFEILPQVDSEVDLVLGESILADYDFNSSRYVRVPQGTYRGAVELLKKARERSPRLQILTLDYWDPSDREGIIDIYKEQRRNGFIPYVATVELDKVIPEPKP
jgi:uncharacterized protein (TIGR01370 family)